MKAKIKLTDKYTGRSINVIVKLEETARDYYEFSYANLTDRQHRKLRNFFGEMNAYYTEREIIKVYNN